jgi:hypothetical protein
MFIRNGQEFNLHLPHIIEGVQYPATWFLDEDQRDVFGVVEIIDPVPPEVTTTQKAVQNGFEFANGVWTAKWEISEQTAEELAATASALTAACVAAVAKTYADVDSVVRDAVGLRFEEYKDAEIDARAFAASGYAGDAPESVACHARSNPTGVAQTDQWAADQIIARADAFAAAKLSMRSNRMDRQADMRAATTASELASAGAAWDSFIATTRAQLGL